MESDLFKTCRSCLRSFPKLRNLFEEFTENGLKLSSCYEVCANLDLSEEDELPKMICIMCESNLMAAFYFRKQCVEAVKLYLVNSSKAVVRKYTPPPPPPKETPLIIKQELHEQCEPDPEEVLETNIKSMAVDKIEQQECVKPELFQDTSNFDPVEEIPAESTHEILQHTIPIVKESRYFQCPKCQKAFISDRHLEIHLKSHKRDPYVCEICNRKCPSKSVLKIHQKKHRAPAADEKVEVQNKSMKEMFVVEYLYGFKPE